MEVADRDTVTWVRRSLERSRGRTASATSFRRKSRSDRRRLQLASEPRQLGALLARERALGIAFRVKPPPGDHRRLRADVRPPTRLRRAGGALARRHRTGGDPPGAGAAPCTDPNARCPQVAYVHHVSASGLRCLLCHQLSPDAPGGVTVEVDCLACHTPNGSVSLQGGDAPGPRRRHAPLRPRLVRTLPSRAGAGDPRGPRRRPSLFANSSPRSPLASAHRSGPPTECAGSFFAASGHAGRARSRSCNPRP
jgi:hypothetical protein